MGGTRPSAAYQTGVTLRTETSRDICFGTAKHTTVQRPRGCVPRATCYHGNGGRKVCSLVELCATLSLVYTWTVFALPRVLATSAVAASGPLRQASTRTGKHASHLCTFNAFVSPTVGVVFNTSMNPLWLGSQPRRARWGRTNILVRSVDNFSIADGPADWRTTLLAEALALSHTGDRRFTLK